LVSLSRCDGLARAAKRVQASAATATADSHFAWLRTRLALERTMMAWQRTAVSLIGFGFAIVQFFEHLQQTPGVRPAEHPHAAQYLGLALISCGVFALVISPWLHRSSVRYLWGGSYAVLAGMTKEGLQPPVVAIAILLILIGVCAFATVVVRLL